jgi:hypothetical protein
VIQASGLVYAQIGKPGELASFLLAMRLMQAVVQFSQAPFYSKIPAMARSYAQGHREAVLSAACRGMRISYAVFLAGIFGIAVCLAPLLHIIHSKAHFVSRDFWAAMAIAFFIERLGAMNMQLYSLSNHIVWHIANGVTGAAYIVLCFFTVPHWGLWGFPVSMAISYLLCYSTYGVHLAHRLFTLRPFRHELSTGALPTGAALVGMLIIFWSASL